jgi:peptidyl-tRNA hydrolase
MMQMKTTVIIQTDIKMATGKEWVTTTSHQVVAHGQD